MSPQWRAWAVTTVAYDSQDTLSFVCALSSLLPPIIVVFIAGIASCAGAFQADRALLLLVALVQNAMLNSVLKKTIRMQRPSSSVYEAVPLSNLSPYGMPSDHTQFMFFFITWLMRKASADRIPLPLSLRLFFLFSAALVAFGRVYNSFHTTEQVVVGALIGVVNGILSTTPFVESKLYLVAVHLMPIRDFCTSWVVCIR
uniref:Uncharacterized protein TCIL3000_6_1410 n=1 Tax=Trypanosoma congolense (strain IL3000) TaxID=1068625 RepID=G0UNE9_TRYCI|nr:unnamed protein product [Trypanosoma congolense IL3000]